MLQPDDSVENTSCTEVPNNLIPVFYTSKTLTTIESNYSNIEHEMLGVVLHVAVQTFYVWHADSYYH